MFKKSILIIVTLLSLQACQTASEIPKNDATGADEMRKSPCVCIDLHYQAPSLTWKLDV